MEMEMETKTLTCQELRGRMVAKGVTVAGLAREAGIVASDVSAILRGRRYLGPERRARLEDAIERLGLDKPIEARNAAGDVVFRIRRLV